MLGCRRRCSPWGRWGRRSSLGSARIVLSRGLAEVVEHGRGDLRQVMVDRRIERQLKDPVSDAEVGFHVDLEPGLPGLCDQVDHPADWRDPFRALARRGSTTDYQPVEPVEVLES